MSDNPVRKLWRCGEQVGRTLYVDHLDAEKDPALLFGLVDTPELAEHIVTIHNWWLDLVESEETAFAAECAEFGCDEQESDTA